MRLNQFWNSFLDLLYPPGETCPLCGNRSPGGIVCRECLQWLKEHASGPVCPICGRFPATGYENSWNQCGFRNPCRLCSARKPPYDIARAVAPYHGVLRDAVLHLKSKGTRRVAAALGKLMAGVARKEPVLAKADVIIPVPLSPKRLACRGFNQAHLLAVELGRILDLPVDSKSVVKIKETRPQTELSRSEREKNLIDAFFVSPSAGFNGKRLLVVDDVFTTGSTVSNIAIKLRQNKTAGVYVLTAAGGVR